MIYRRTLASRPISSTVRRTVSYFINESETQENSNEHKE